jgi:uncharacterized integral membrane protein
MVIHRGRDNGAHTIELGEIGRTGTRERGGWLRGRSRTRREAQRGLSPLPEPPADGARVPQPPGPRPPHRTRAGSTWVAACVAVLILVALVIFIAQNAGAVQVSFVSLHGRFSLAVALLAAVTAGCLLTLVLGTTRILQLRRLVRRHHRDDLAAAVVSHTPDTLSGAPQPRHAVGDVADTAGTG